MRRHSFVLQAVVAILAASAWAAPPVTVSPGRSDLVVEVAGRCPTFSWGFVSLAPALRLEAWAVTNEDAQQAARVLAVDLAGSATSWTPELERCLAPGATYAWRVGAPGEGDAVEWSEAAWFFVAPEAGFGVTGGAGVSRGQNGSAATGGSADAESGGTASPESLAESRPVPAHARAASFFSVGNGGAVSAGAVAATSFAGDGAALTNLTPENLAAGTAGIDISGSAASVSGVVGVTHGGTGADNADDARTNLGAAAASHGHGPGDVTGLSEGGVTFGGGGGGALTQDAANFLWDDANKQLEIKGTIQLPMTAAPGGVPSAGVLYLGTAAFLHNYHPWLNSFNTFVGRGAGNFTMYAPQVVESNYNTAVGTESLSSIEQASLNTAVGARSLHSNQYGEQNTALGSSALAANQSGGANTAVGYASLASVTISHQNAGFGNGAGGLATGSGNLFLGSFAGPSESDASDNRLYVANASGTPLIFGEFDTHKVGIYLTDPSVALDVNGQVRSRVWSGTGDLTVCRDGNGVLVPCSGTADGVTSFNARTGAVTASSGDYDASQIANTPGGEIEANNVQAALNELDTEKATASHGHVPAEISPQGAGSTLDADLLDGQHAAAFAVSGHLHEDTYQRKYVRTVVVSPVPGDPAASGTALLAAVAGIIDASASNPYLVKVEPGTYDVGTETLYLGQGLDLEGSGEPVTTITGNGATNGTVNGSLSELRFLTVETTGGASSACALMAYDMRLRHITVVAQSTVWGEKLTGINAGGSPELSDVAVAVSAVNAEAKGIWINLPGGVVSLQNVEINVSTGPDAGFGWGIDVWGSESGPTVDLRTSRIEVHAGHHPRGISQSGGRLLVRDTTILADSTSGWLESHGIALSQSSLQADNVRITVTDAHDGSNYFGIWAYNSVVDAAGLTIDAPVPLAIGPDSPAEVVASLLRGSIYGIHNGGIGGVPGGSALTVRNSTVSASHPTSGIGLRNQGADGSFAVVLDNCQLLGPAHTVSNDVAFATRIQGSVLNGGPVNVVGGTVTCIDCIDAASGRVAIGTYAPTDTLDVDGTVRVRTWTGTGDSTVCRDADGVLVPCSGTADGVTSFNSRTGAVTSASGDYTADQVSSAVHGEIQSTNLQDAIEELEDEKAPSSHMHPLANITGLTAGGVVFGGGAGTPVQDASSLFWDDTSNRLGIGTASPAKRLHVVAVGEEAARIESSGYATKLQLVETSTAVQPLLQLGADAATNMAVIEANNAGTAGATIGLEIHTRNAGVSNNSAMVITGPGRVGIGTTSPTDTLHVNGTLRVGTWSGTGDSTVCRDGNDVLVPCSGTADGVTSFNARAGAVVPASGDYAALQIASSAHGEIQSTNAQSAINELEDEKAPLSHTHLGSAITSAVAEATNADTLDGLHASAFTSRLGRAGYSLSSVDIPSAVGLGVTLAIGADGLGLMAYQDAANPNLVVAHCADTGCTSADTITALGSTNVDQELSIAVGADGLGLIAYTDADNWDLMVAHCEDIRCTVATTAVLDADGIAASSAAIAVGVDGRALIAYYDAVNDDLKVAHCSADDCSTATKSTLDSGGDVGTDACITIGADGRGLIAYKDATNLDLKVAHCNDLTCTSAGITTLDTTGDVGGSASVTTGNDGFGLVSYNDWTNFDLKVAHCNNAACSAAAISVLDAAGFVGEFTSATIGTDGLGLISYWDRTNSDLKVAHCSNVLCSEATAHTLDTASDGPTSIAIGVDGFALIGYVVGYNLKAVHCSNVFCMPYFWRR